MRYKFQLPTGANLALIQTACLVEPSYRLEALGPYEYHVHLRNRTYPITVDLDSQEVRWQPGTRSAARRFVALLDACQKIASQPDTVVIVDRGLSLIRYSKEPKK